MKVLFISRATLFKDPGGDTIQIINTAENLKKLEVDVDIKVANDKINYRHYDLIHFFNIIRPSDILAHISKNHKPFVVSTIFVDYSEYEKKQRKGFAGTVFKILSPDFIEYAKVIARNIIAGERVLSLSYLLLGQKRSIRKILKQTSLLLPNSNNEYKRLYKRYGVKKNYKVIPNAIDPDLFATKQSTIKDNRMVLCVGRIEGRKNQLNLIKAINNSGFKLKIIGSYAINQPAYYRACRDAASADVEFIENLPQSRLIDYYSIAKVHVLPSWFETTGLSSLEAAVMGCNIVITDKGDTKEYFEDMAYYCDPGSPKSIKDAIESAAGNPPNEDLKNKILREYTWPVTAKKTLEAYHKVLDKQ